MKKTYITPETEISATLADHDLLIALSASPSQPKNDSPENQFAPVRPDLPQSEWDKKSLW